MPIEIVDFPESTARTRSKTVTLPNLTSVTSVTVNTGNVSYTVSGEDVTVTVSNGAYTRYSTYTPSKTAYGSRTGGYGATYPSSISYNDGTYSGTLYKSGSPVFVSGEAAHTEYKYNVSVTKLAQATNTWEWNGSSWDKIGTSYSPSSVYYCDGYDFCGTLPINSSTAGAPYPLGTGQYVGDTTTTSGSYANSTFKGTLSKSFPDTRTYRQDYSGTVYASTNYTYYYAYTVTIDYVDRVKVGAYKYNTVVLPIYDPAVGMNGVNQLRTVDKNGNVACFELVDTADSLASPFRCFDGTTIKAIARE